MTRTAVSAGRPRSIAVALALVLAAGACGSSREALSKKLFELKSQRTQALDGLYRDYEEVAGGTDWDSKLQGTPEILRKAARIVEGVSLQLSRQVFDEQVRQLGQGDRPVALSGAARDFFAGDDVRKRARHVVELDTKIDALQRRLDTMAP